MARGGIFDQLGGGFHRYSTDEFWLVPHFEKMLYDNGQLLRVYAEAFRQTGGEKLRWPVEETIAWLEREMRDPAGGFYASQDADSEGEEGRFFVWSPDEIRAVLGPELGDEFCAAYGVESAGNFEHSGKSVLAHGLAGDRPRFAAARTRLMAARINRAAPYTDKKNVCSWIGYAISGLALAGSSFGRAESGAAGPAPSGLAVLALLRIAELTGRADLAEVVEAVIERQGPVASRAPLYLPTLTRAAALRESQLGVAIILGPQSDARTHALAARARSLLGPEDAVVVVDPAAPPEWLAAEWLEGRELRGGAPTAYICRGRFCSLPANDPSELRVLEILAPAGAPPRHNSLLPPC